MKTQMPDIPITSIDEPPIFVRPPPVIFMLDGKQVYGVVDIIREIGDTVDVRINGEPMIIRVISNDNNPSGGKTITAETLMP